MNNDVFLDNAAFFDIAETEIAFQNLSSPVHSSFPTVENVEEEVDYYQQISNSFEQLEKEIKAAQSDCLADPKAVELKHNYADKEHLVWDPYLMDWVEYLPVSAMVDNITGLKCNINLAKAIKKEKWLQSEMVNECVNTIITLEKKRDQFLLVDSYFYAYLRDSTMSDGLYSHLQRWEAGSKKGVFVVMNTSLQRGFHWMLGYISLEKRFISICDPLIDWERDYWAYFASLYKLVLLIFHQMKKPTTADKWSFFFFSDVAQQPNTWDCGVYVCFYTKQILSGHALQKCNDCDKEREYVKKVLFTEFVPDKPNIKGKKFKSCKNMNFDRILSNDEHFEI